MNSRRHAPLPVARPLARLVAHSLPTLIALTALATLPALAADDPAALREQLARADRRADDAQVEKLATQLLAADGQEAEAYYFRGRARFRQGKFAASVEDFDQYVEKRPAREPQQWERGIALYYAGQFARGAKQFELYQTFDSRDVENSVWRYLCLARSEGVEKARATMLPIAKDPRVPMMEIYDLYRGEKKIDEVLAAARAGDPPAEVLAGRLFYTHLYLGLYFEAQGQADEAQRYLKLAADEKLATNPRINAYMWAVARVHVQRPPQPKTDAK